MLDMYQIFALILISIDKLDDDGYINQFGEGKWKLIKGSLVLAKGRKVNTLYIIEAKIKKDVNEPVKDSDMRHGIRDLVTLVRKG